ncbi:MaoC family dehydratase [Fictibacillus enclensis]|uniref:MaoC family dehydratase n=1 Tax=Fictibacillus enclensis TaxID=1017270 RepID=UPI0025A26F41|nr:MaoC family dehydratase [Fictibacillus enclensis]MDM5201122.1 MaoC family dehydratase [Fictibacillus enclensis]
MSTLLLNMDDIEIGKQQTTIRNITDEDVEAFGRLSGDFNPLHMNDEFASKSHFGRRVVHGMFTAAIISATHTDLTGPGFVYVGQELNFKAPVYIGDTITVTVTVTGKKEDKRILILETMVSKQDGSVVLQGNSALMELEGLKARRVVSQETEHA